MEPLSGKAQAGMNKKKLRERYTVVFERPMDEVTEHEDA
jgi:hypothetical protein